MAKPLVSDNNSDHLQTWILKVYIHCEGCKKKVFKVLQSIDGVYKTEIDSKQHKAIVTGSVNGETLVQKLLKSGKHAEILPESFEHLAAMESENANGNQKKKKKQNKSKQNDQIDDAEHVNEENSDVAIDTKNDQEIVEPDVPDTNGNGGDAVTIGDAGSGKKKKKKKKKGPPNGDREDVSAIDTAADTGVISMNNLEGSMEKLNLDTPSNQMVYSTPYDVPAYHNYNPIPPYGMSYNTSYPSTESSYYTPPVYGYAQSHPSVFNPPRPPLSYYGRSAFDDHDDEGGDGRGCVVM